MNQNKVDPNGSPELPSWDIEPAFKDYYWTLVADCLARFFHLTDSDASEKVGSLRERIEHPPAGIRGEFSTTASLFRSPATSPGITTT